MLSKIDQSKQLASVIVNTSRLIRVQNDHWSGCRLHGIIWKIPGEEKRSERILFSPPAKSPQKRCSEIFPDANYVQSLTAWKNCSRSLSTSDYRWLLEEVMSTAHSVDIVITGISAVDISVKSDRTEPLVIVDSMWTTFNSSWADVFVEILAMSKMICQRFHQNKTEQSSEKRSISFCCCCKSSRGFSLRCECNTEGILFCWIDSNKILCRVFKSNDYNNWFKRKEGIYCKSRTQCAGEEVKWCEFTRYARFSRL